MKKINSHGEFVFDHAWANVYQQLGLNYYPKLVIASPFTPITGARLLVKGCKSGGPKKYFNKNIKEFCIKKIFLVFMLTLLIKMKLKVFRKITLLLDMENNFTS